MFSQASVSYSVDKGVGWFEGGGGVSVGVCEGGMQGGCVGEKEVCRGVYTSFDERHMPHQRHTPWTRGTPPTRRHLVVVNASRYASYWNAFLFSLKIIHRSYGQPRKRNNRIRYLSDCFPLIWVNLNISCKIIFQFPGI